MNRRRRGGGGLGRRGRGAACHLVVLIGRQRGRRSRRRNGRLLGDAGRGRQRRRRWRRQVIGAVAVRSHVDAGAEDFRKEPTDGRVVAAVAPRPSNRLREGWLLPATAAAGHMCGYTCNSRRTLVRHSIPSVCGETRRSEANDESGPYDSTCVLRERNQYWHQTHGTQRMPHKECVRDKTRRRYVLRERERGCSDNHSTRARQTHTLAHNRQPHREEQRVNEREK